MLRHLRPRRHQPDHRHCHRLYGFLSRGLHHLQRALRRPCWQGRLPGGGHHRHRHAHHQGHLSGARTPRPSPTSMRQAFAVAATGRPGPVLIDFLKNVTVPMKRWTTSSFPGKQNRGLRQHPGPGLPRHEPQAAGARPGGCGQAGGDDCPGPDARCCICGGGVVRRAAPDRQFREFAEKLDAPVAIHRHGRRRLPRRPSPDHRHDRACTAPRPPTSPVTSCDLLIAVGCRFSDRVALAPCVLCSASAKIVQIDIDRAEIDKNVLTDHHIIGDARRVLELLNERLTAHDYPGMEGVCLLHAREVGAADRSQVTSCPRQVLDTITPPDRRGTPLWPPTWASIRCGLAQHFHFNYPGQLHHHRRLRHHGLRPGCRHGRQNGQSRTKWWSTPPATAASA